MHENRGVKFEVGRKFIRFDSKENDPSEIGRVNLTGTSLETDYVLLFPSSYKADTEFVSENKKLVDNIKFDFMGRIKSEYSNRTGNKRLFVAGEPSAMTWFTTTERITENSPHKNFNEGFNAAYNILGLVRIHLNLIIDCLAYSVSDRAFHLVRYVWTHNPTGRKL
jgi:hypothetical protein